MKSKTKYKFSTMFLITLLLLLTLGYAYLTQTLNINGLSKVNNASWNVYWDNVQVTSGSVEADTPTISNQTTVSFNVHLSKPGDFYEFTVDAKNDGTIDAMIDTINKTTTVPDYINYTVTYADDGTISKNQLLASNSKELYKVRVEYRTDINANELPNSSESLTLSFGVTYIQADNNAEHITHTVYINNLAGSIIIGSPFPDNIVYFYDYHDAFGDVHGEAIFLKLIIENNTVKDSYVGIIYNDELIYLHGGINENGLTNHPVYEENKSIILRYFEPEECYDVDTHGIYSDLRTNCYRDGLGLSADTKGNVSAMYHTQSYICFASFEDLTQCDYID